MCIPLSADGSRGLQSHVSLDRLQSRAQAQVRLFILSCVSPPSTRKTLGVFLWPRAAIDLHLHFLAVGTADSFVALLGLVADT